MKLFEVDDFKRNRSVVGVTRKRVVTPIVLRNYQESAISKLGNTGIQVLSICPGGGKTFTAIEFINRSSFKRVLILAHGTNVLKSQWKEELTKLGMAYSTDLDSSERIIVTLPHSLKNMTRYDFDLIIVDEAHEFYYAEKMIQSALEIIKPKCQLLLTGTPSKFIRKGLKPVIVSGCEVYNEKGGYLANTYFGVVRSTYELDLDQYSKETGEVIDDSVFTDEETISSLECLVRDMIKRLEAPDVVKSSPNFNNSMSYVGLSKIQTVFAKLGKTLIACKSIQQAQALTKHLIECNVNAIVSESESDIESLNVKEFMENDLVQVLLVVRRGILGFNYPELVNVVDFTMSRNIDRIYQLYARVLRTHPNAPNKFFFRLCSALNPTIDAYFLQAAMCLNSPDFMSKWNGKNLKQLPIIVPKKREINSNVPVEKPDSNKPKNVSIDQDMLDCVLGLELLTELKLKPESKYWYEFGYMKFGEVVSKLNGVSFFNYNSDEKKLQILEFININGRRPSYFSKNLQEKKLYVSLRSYVGPSSGSFDSEFKAKVDASYDKLDSVSINKQRILEFIKINNRKPSKCSKDLEESNLSNRMHTYTSPSNGCFDVDFKDKIDKLCQSKHNPESKKEKILEFISINNRRPSSTSKDSDVRRLGNALVKYISDKSGCFDPEFKKQVDELLKSVKGE